MFSLFLVALLDHMNLLSNMAANWKVCLAESSVILLQLLKHH